jgi:type I restriction enzyme M protein
LFRGGAEGKIRQKLIEENVLDTVIGLPSNLFFGTGIPAAILIFDRSRESGGDNADRKDVLFIDASREFHAGKNQNFLRDEDLETIARVYRGREARDRYSRNVPVEEIAENDFNLNIPRYVDTFEETAPVDLKALQHEIDGLEKELAEVRAKLATHLRELELI